MRSLSFIPALFLSLFFASVIAMPVTVAAQTTDDSTARKEATPLPNVTGENKTEITDDSYRKAEEVTHQIRAEERRMDYQETGLRWVPYSSVGQTTREFLEKRDPRIGILLDGGHYVDVAVYDFDGNGKADIALYFWGGCGNQGCMFKIFYDRQAKKPESYFGKRIAPHKQGMMLDDAYFSL